MVDFRLGSFASILLRPLSHCPVLTLFALPSGPRACLQAACTKALAHLYGVLARRLVYSHLALAHQGPCLQASVILFASRYTYGTKIAPLLTNVVVRIIEEMGTRFAASKTVVEGRLKLPQ